MARFLRLTNGYSTHLNLPVYVNLDLVTAISESQHPSYKGFTCLGGMGDDSVIAMVVETPEQIIEMLSQGQGV